MGLCDGNCPAVGASVFLTGSIMFGITTRHASVLPRNAGLLLAGGSFLWLVAFYFPPQFLLSIANILSAVALLWMGVAVYPRTQAGILPVRQAA